MSFDSSKSLLQEVVHPDFLSRGITLFIKRDDLIHHFVSGNKWRKLKYNFQQFYHSKKEQIITFGGAFSNHLLATASACNLEKIPCIGIVRGEELKKNSNDVLKKCADLGMKLHFISRMEYEMRSDKEYLEELAVDYPNSFMVPEGGANYLGIIGCQEILSEIETEIDHVFVAQGTSTTSCGLLLHNSCKKLHVVPVLKGYDSFSEMRNLFFKAGIPSELVDELLCKVVVHEDYHFGGYGKWNDELLAFIEWCGVNYQLPLDKIYTAKAFSALMDEVNKGSLDHQTVVFIHTGGLFTGYDSSGDLFRL